MSYNEIDCPVSTFNPSFLSEAFDALREGQRVTGFEYQRTSTPIWDSGHAEPIAHLTGPLTMLRVVFTDKNGHNTPFVVNLDHSLFEVLNNVLGAFVYFENLVKTDHAVKLRDLPSWTIEDIAHAIVNGPVSVSQSRIFGRTTVSCGPYSYSFVCYSDIGEYVDWLIRVLRWQTQGTKAEVVPLTGPTPWPQGYQIPFTEVKMPAISNTPTYPGVVMEMAPADGVSWGGGCSQAYSALVEVGQMNSQELKPSELVEIVTLLFGATDVVVERMRVMFTTPDGIARCEELEPGGEPVVELLKRLIKAKPADAGAATRRQILWEELVSVAEQAYSCGLIGRLGDRIEDQFRGMDEAELCRQLEAMERSIEIYKLTAAIRLQGGTEEESNAAARLMQTESAPAIADCKNAVLEASKGGWRRPVTEAAVG